MNRTRAVIVFAVVLVLLAAAAAYAIETGTAKGFQQLSTDAKRVVFRILWKSVAFALGVVALGVALPIGIPALWIAAAAGGTFIATGGYEIVQAALGVLPKLPQLGAGGGSGGSADPCIDGPYTDAAGVVHLCN